MAFTKPVTIPGGYAASYFSVNRIVIDEDARDASMVIKVRKDKATADSGEPGIEIGAVRFTGAAFDLFFSKDAIVAANLNAYAGVYQAIAVVNAAFKAKSENVPLTDAQKIITGGLVQIPFDPRYGGALFFDGSTLA